MSDADFERLTVWLACGGLALLVLLGVAAYEDGGIWGYLAAVGLGAFACPACRWYTKFIEDLRS